MAGKRHFQSAIATGSLLRVAGQLLKNDETENLSYISKTFESCGMGYLFEKTSLNYLYTVLKTDGQIVLTGIGKTMAGFKMVLYLDKEKLTWTNLADEHGVAKLNVNTFAVSSKPNLGMVDGLIV